MGKKVIKLGLSGGTSVYSDPFNMAEADSPIDFIGDTIADTLENLEGAYIGIILPTDRTPVVGKFYNFLIGTAEAAGNLAGVRSLCGLVIKAKVTSVDVGSIDGAVYDVYVSDVEIVSNLRPAKYQHIITVSVYQSTPINIIVCSNTMTACTTIDQLKTLLKLNVYHKAMGKTPEVNYNVSMIYLYYISAANNTFFRFMYVNSSGNIVSQDKVLTAVNFPSITDSVHQIN